MATRNQLPLYRKWRSMLNRCNNVNDGYYYRYGGRGIVVSSEWLDYDCFVKDMLPSYVDGLSIERIDNDGPYSKENCRWATAEEQANNRSSNKLLTIGDETKTLASWCRTSKVKPSTIRQRLYGYGWSIERALAT